MGKSRQTGWIIGLMLFMVAAWHVPGPALEIPLNGKSWALWGTSRETRRLGREETVARENYCPTGGCVIRLDRVSVKPLRARAGDTLVLSTSYTLLTPEHIAIPVSISREIFFQGKSLGKTKSTDTRTLNGTFDQEINFQLPANAAAGSYTLVTVISTGYGQDQKTVDFRVE
jgi:hypothetical protein